MNRFIHAFGVLSRDMLFLGGHFTNIQGLGGTARRERPRTATERRPAHAGNPPPQPASCAVLAECD